MDGPFVKQALLPDEIILETDHFRIAQDCEVPIEGFLILAAKRHLRSIADLSDDELTEFSTLLKKARIAMQEIGIDDVYIFQNEDTEHGFHIWLFPRHDWMQAFGNKIQSVRPIMEYAKQRA
jgi:diadenosine tetraphosphate (Ap4A) HIT family hydrolase